MPPGKRSSSSIDDGSKGSPTRPATGTDKARLLLSPLKRLKSTMDQKARVRVVQEEIVLSTVEEFRAHVTREDASEVISSAVVVVRGTLVWKSEHVYNERTLVRLHFTDAEPEETFQELREFEVLHGVDEEHRVEVDSVLLTVTVFGETLASQTLPQNGRVVRIRNSRRRAVYDGKFCQLVTRCADMLVE